MKSKYVASALSLLLLASVLAVGFTIRSVSAQTATLSIPSVAENPSDNGTLFTVPVQISSVSDLFGFDINITWDNTLITLSNLNSTYLNAIWPQGFYDVFYQNGSGYVDYAAVATGGSGYTNTGTNTLFSLTFQIINTGNFPLSTPIHFYSVKLSDSEANAITAILNDGSYSMSATTPGIYFTLVDPNHAKPWEYGKYFEVEVYATNIVSTLTGYDLKVDYDSELLTFVQVQPDTPVAYVLAAPTVNNALGVVELSVSSGGTFVGNNGLLFTLTFQVSFAQSYTTIWRSNSTNQLTATISLDTTTGSLTFTEGSIPTGLIAAPAVLTLTIYLIRGDVACTGDVTVLDLRDVAIYYDQSTTSGPAALYDIKIDSNNIIDIYDLVEVATNIGYNNPDTLPTTD